MKEQTTSTSIGTDGGGAGEQRPRLDVEFRDVGRMAYEPALELQRELHGQVRAGERGPVVLIVEHEPVVTVSKRDAAPSHLLASPALLEREGVSVCRTDRGGDITYHGPGQLVVYPILPLRWFGLNVRQHVHMLEQVVIDTLGRFGVAAHRDACAVGVWVGGEAEAGGAACDAGGTGSTEERRGAATGGEGKGGGAKIAAIGVRVQRWISLHGLALNVEPDMEHFKLIVPCGLAGRRVTSLAEQLGGRCPGMEQVKGALREVLAGELLRRVEGGEGE